MEFNVSVIIPVFNCEPFIEMAVSSALSCPEVFEVILIDDGSKDLSLLICKNLELKYPKVHLYIHSNNSNQGPSISRNLGIEKSKAPFIAFLDADDWYLTNRFEKDKERFTLLDGIDAVYSCSTMDNDVDRNNFFYGVRSKDTSNLEPRLHPVNFYEKCVKNKLVLFDTNSITIRRSFLQKYKPFDERLYLHQDVELWKRLMREGVFVAGDWENPVSVFRRHSGNRITSKSWKSYLKMIKVHLDNVGIQNLHKFEINDFYTRIWRLRSQKYTNTFKRRFFYYSNYFIFLINKISILERLVSSDDND
jgi:glycosyltransferase involved in cell wall biosynthesis